MFFKQFFQDEQDRFSMQRLTTFALVITSILLSVTCIWFIFIGKVITEIVYLVGVLLGFATGSKVWSKYVENKKRETESSENVS